MLYDIKGAIYRLRDIKQELYSTRTADNEFNFWVIMLEHDIEGICKKWEKLSETCDSKLSILESSCDSSKL